ncbi:hypothetical protein BGZ65_010515, partial [Modicella reniformis]
RLQFALEETHNNTTPILGHKLSPSHIHTLFFLMYPLDPLNTQDLRWQTARVSGPKLIRKRPMLRTHLRNEVKLEPHRKAFLARKGSHSTLTN